MRSATDKVSIRNINVRMRLPASRFAGNRRAGLIWPLRQLPEQSVELAVLLATLEPKLSDDEMVFCSFPGGRIEENLSLSPIASYAEEEGISLIISKAVAEQHGIAFETTFRVISLTVHSSLESVGLTAAVAGRLAQHGISANVVAAYHHDHIFVPARDAERALASLRTLQAEAAAQGIS
jgi:hypothetical protein